MRYLHAATIGAALFTLAAGVVLLVVSTALMVSEQLGPYVAIPLGLAMLGAVVGVIAELTRR